MQHCSSSFWPVAHSFGRGLAYCPQLFCLGLGITGFLNRIFTGPLQIPYRFPTNFLQAPGKFHTGLHADPLQAPCQILCRSLAGFMQVPDIPPTSSFAGSLQAPLAESLQIPYKFLATFPNTSPTQANTSQYSPDSPYISHTSPNIPKPTQYSPTHHQCYPNTPNIPPHIPNIPQTSPIFPNLTQYSPHIPNTPQATPMPPKHPQHSPNTPNACMFLACSLQVPC